MLGTYTSPWMTEDLSIFKDAVNKFMPPSLPGR